MMGCDNAMMFLLSIFKAHKIIGGLFAGSFGLFAWAETTSDRGLIIVSVVGMALTFLGVLITSAVQIWISWNNSRKLDPLSLLPKQVEEMKTNIDGKFDELRQAEKGLARREGAEQERVEARDRAAAAPSIAEAIPPAKVEIVQPPGKSVPVKPDKE